MNRSSSTCRCKTCKCSVIGTKEGDFNLRNADVNRVIDLGLKIVFAASSKRQNPMDIYHAHHYGRSMADHPDQSLEVKIEGKQLTKQGKEWLTPKMRHIELLVELELQKLEEKIKELGKARRKDEAERFKELGKRLGDVREDVKDRTRNLGQSATEELSKITKNLGHAYLMFNVAQFMFLGGVTLALTLIRRCTKFFAWLTSNSAARILMGVSMTIVFIVGINIDTGWLKSINRVLGNVKNGARSFVKSMFKEVSEGNNLVEKSSFILGMLIGGFGMVMKTLGIQFYTSDEICYKIGEYLNMVARGAGDVWNMIMGFKIPFVEQTLFDMLIGFALGGPIEVLGDALMGMVMNKVVAPMLNKMIIDMIANLILSV